MPLVIVESPTKAKTIKKFLKKGYTVESSYGHIRDLPKSNKDAVDIKGGFVPHYVIPPKKKDAVAKLKQKAKKADEIILATDPDREGEAIAWHLTQILNTKVPTKRIVFHEITDEAVRDALEHPRSIDEDLRRAQEARRVLDRLVGYDLSGLIWKKVRYGLSAGRVQSPALRILVEREREIRAFKPEQYWVLTAETKTPRHDALTLISQEEPGNEARVKEILDAAKASPWHVAATEERHTSRAPNPPFTTSTLQQRASTLLGFSPSRTMRAAQRLYEAGHITYMRTDSPSMSKSAQERILAYVEKTFGKEYAKARVYKTKSKSAQEAHEAIRPTNVARKTAGKGTDEKRLYALIWRRAVSSQMARAKLIRTKIVGTAEDSHVPEFTAKGVRVMFEGWFKADPSSRGEEVELPEVVKGDALTLVDISSEEKQTQPPPRYTEAGLVKELEKRGIGRPSTYASIMQTLHDRAYVTKEGRSLRPTDVGEVISSFLEEHFGQYINDTFTAEMEDELDEIAAGKRNYKKTLRDFYTPFHKNIEERTKNAKKLTTLGDAPKEFTCPKCNGAMVIKLGRSGKFLSCARFPDCDGARTMEGKESGEPKETGESCPECKEGNLVTRHGRYGEFIGCNRYPKCKYVKNSDENDESTGVTCPECVSSRAGEGKLVGKRGRYGPFFACSNYPKCKYTMKARPTGKKCKECDSLMMQGTKTIPERCSDKKCPNHNPHKK